jgi:hypothetical protein
MKSSCCHDKVFIVGDETKHYRCERCQQACDAVAFMQYTVKHVEPCIRCDKLTDRAHTCTPTKQFRAGIIDGLRMTKDVILSLGDYNNTADYVWAKSDGIEAIEKLIKQYSGEE